MRFDQSSSDGPPSGAHAVQFYEGEPFLIESVSRFIAPALAGVGAGIVIATEPHRIALADRLRTRGVDLTTVLKQGRYVALDAAETLSQFMVGGRLNEARFTEVVGGIIARTAATDQSLRVHAFGEMVALLWADGKAEAAIRLEQLWNELGSKLSFSLLCAYPLSEFGREGHGESLRSLCAEHSHVIPAESYSGLTTPDDRLRAITELQQKANALESEIAERKKIEQELKVRLAELADVDRRKDEFLAMLGHELRNPLAAVRNALVTAELDPMRRARALDIARRQADQLARLVDDLLDVARITRGRIRLKTQRVRFAAIVERALDTTRQLVEERAHTITLSLPPVDLWVDADATRLEQVVVNLVSNAAKYTEPGGRIDVTAERRDAEIVLRVRDNGIGIAQETLPYVFDLFAQADRALDRAQGGLGIGLTVVRRLVELHGGRVNVHSDGLGRGAEFVVCLPALDSALESHAPAPTATHARPTCVRVLIVEDNRDAAESLLMLLELLGHQVEVFHDGASALDAARANVPDVMLIDIGLPGIDGFEIARRVRADATLRGVTLVALTGYGLDEDRRRTRAVGFDHHLVKPIEVDALQSIVSGASSASPKTRTLH